MRKIQETEISGKKILVRVDYNIPIQNGVISNNERIVASLETIKYLLNHGAAVVLCSHLGRPEGRPNPLYSLRPIARELEKLIKKNVQFIDDCVGDEKDNKVASLKSGEIILLENLRFHPEEEGNNSEFAKKLAIGCDIYVNDAFSASHREHASIVSITKDLPSFAGVYLQKEIENLSKVLVEPKRPFVLVMGGAKIVDKIPLIENMITKIDTLILGGAIANTFLAAKGYRLGKSVVEPESIDLIKKVLVETRDNNVKILLPEDCLVGESTFAPNGEEKPINQVNENEMVLDIGSTSISNFAESFKFAETIFWNGPMGYTETSAFANGTKRVGQAIANSNAFSVIGGGDTIAALNNEVKAKYSYVSMAGGASLEFLSGKKLPGIVVLES